MSKVICPIASQSPLEEADCSQFRTNYMRGEAVSTRTCRGPSCYRYNVGREMRQDAPGPPKPTAPTSGIAQAGTVDAAAVLAPEGTIRRLEKQLRRLAEEVAALTNTVQAYQDAIVTLSQKVEQLEARDADQSR